MVQKDSQSVPAQGSPNLVSDPVPGYQAVWTSVLGWFGLAAFSQRFEPWFCLIWWNLTFCL